MPNSRRGVGDGKRFDPSAAVTDRIIEALEGGTAPWRQPWRSGGAEANLASRKPYRRIDQLLSPLHGFESPWWLTFMQLAGLGGRIRERQARRAGGRGGALVTFYRATSGIAVEFRTDDTVNRHM